MAGTHARGQVIYDANFNAQPLGPLATGSPPTLPTQIGADASHTVNVVASAGDLTDKPVLMHGAPLAAFYNPVALFSGNWRVSWDSLVLGTPTDGDVEDPNVQLVNTSTVDGTEVMWTLKYLPSGQFSVQDGFGFRSAVGNFAVGQSDHFDLYLNLMNFSGDYELFLNHGSLLTGPLAPNEFGIRWDDNVFRNFGHLEQQPSDFAFDNYQVAAVVPEPATVILVGVALAAMIGSLSQRSNSRRTGRRTNHRYAVRRSRLEPLEDRRLLSFTPAVIYPAGAAALVTEVVTADFNNDGNLDLATTNVYSQVNVLLGNGAGGFAAAQQFNPGGFSLAAGDLNKDGKIDLVTANHSDGRVGILFGKGDGTFQPVVTKNTSGYPLAVAVADFNADGNLDIVVIEDGESTWVQVLLGNGAGSFTAKHELGVYAVAGLAVGDLNGDGMLDVVMLGAHLAGQEQAQGGQVLLGRGDGTFRYAPYLYTGPDPLGVAIADFTGDGKPDLLVAAQDVELIRGNGDGSFDVLVDGYTANGAAHAGVATGDFNADGKLDAVVSDLDTNTVSMMLGNADGTLRYAGAFAAGQAPTDITVGDFNRDGRLDVAVTGFNSGSATVSVLLNDGNWPAAGPALTGDYNGNGEVDAADYIVWRKTLGTGGVTAFSGADGDGNGTIEPNDHVVWRANFGNVPPPAAGSGAGEASSVQIQELRSDAPAVRNIAANNIGVSVVQIPMEAISAPAEIVAVAAQSASFAALEIRSLWHDSSRRSRGRIDQYQVADSGDDDLPLLLAIDRVGRSPRQDSFVSDDNGNSELRADDDDSESEIGTVRNAELLHFVRLISATG